MRDEIEKQIEILKSIKYSQEFKLYILNLLGLHEDNDFKLDFIMEGSIWFGTKKLEKVPTKEFISRIMPPKKSPEKFNYKISERISD